ncbi:MAG: hypothetical protein ABIQ01_04505 [Pseudolysinimonas sp.]
MRAVVRGWLGFVALGAGLLHLALVIGSPLLIAIPLIAIGAAEFAWGVFAFTAPALPLPRVAGVAALVPILGWVLLLAIAGTGGGAIGGIRVLPLLVASLLDLAIAIGITWMLRRDPARPEAPLRPGRYLLALGAGALVVAALTTPALAATEAGDVALPHGTVDEPGDIDLPGGHGGH